MGSIKDYKPNADEPRKPLDPTTVAELREAFVAWAPTVVTLPATDNYPVDNANAPRVVYVDGQPATAWSGGTGAVGAGDSEAAAGLVAGSRRVAVQIES